MENKDRDLTPDEMESVMELFQKLIVWRDEAKLKELEVETAKLKSRIELAKNSNLPGRPLEIENAKSVVSDEFKK